MRQKRLAWGGLVLAAALALMPAAASAAETTAADSSAGIEPIPALGAARIAEDLGVLKGDGEGVTDTYLAQETTRLQAAILYLRLIGKESEALAFAGANGFP